MSGFKGANTYLLVSNDKFVRMVALQVNDEFWLVALPVTRGDDTCVVSEPATLLVLILVV